METVSASEYEEQLVIFLEPIKDSLLNILPYWQDVMDLSNTLTKANIPN